MNGVAVRSYGTGALLVEAGSATGAVALRGRLDADAPAGVVETMPGLQTVLVRFDPAVVDAPGLARRLVELASSLADVAPAGGPEVEAVTVRVEYDGDDLDEVADRSGLSVDAVVAAHLAPSYRVVLIGMAPGFYFLAGGDERLQVPRRSSPREAVPRGAVGLAGAYTGIYPRRGPGGWALIGRVVDELWHTDRHPAAKLAPGAVVRFAIA